MENWSLMPLIENGRYKISNGKFTGGLFGSNLKQANYAESGIWIIQFAKYWRW